MHQSAPTQRHRRNAFTLVEILIVVVILGILASVVVPQFANAAVESRRMTTATNLKTFARQFNYYYSLHGNWPADRNHAILPPEMTGLIDADAFALTTPEGGHWDWDYNHFGVTASVSIRQPTANLAEMQALDRAVDDGDLTTGSFQRSGDRFLFILER
jgi:prepilin-type N-terminal cleavage/methylation domain-containing protein